MEGFEDSGQIIGLELRDCKNCGCNRWEAFTRRISVYVTAFAYCQNCHTLYFSSGEDYYRDDAILELHRLINSGSAPP